VKFDFSRHYELLFIGIDSGYLTFGGFRNDSRVVIHASLSRAKAGLAARQAEAGIYIIEVMPNGWFQLMPATMQGGWLQYLCYRLPLSRE